MSVGNVSIRDKILSQESLGNFTIIGATEGKKDYIDVVCVCGNFTSVNLYGVNKGETKSCGCIKKVSNLSVGDYFEGKKWGGYKIVAIRDSESVDIVFDTGNMKTITATQARSGSVWNPLQVTVMGVGYLGEGEYKSRYKSYTTKTPQYRAWENMMARCYYPKASRYQAYGGKGVEVCKDWHNFQNFAKWFDLNYREGCDLDKDILGDGMLYSPEFCRYIPQSLNKALTLSPTRLGRRDNDYPEGVYLDKNRSTFVARFRKDILGEFTCQQKASETYKTFKTAYIRGLVQELFTAGEICNNVYNVLVNYDAEEGHK